MSRDSNSNDESNVDSSNPFISFRRLVDDHITSAIRSLNEQAGIPTEHHATPSDRTPDESLSALFNIFGQPSLYGLIANPAAKEMSEFGNRAPQRLQPTQLWGCLFKAYRNSQEKELEFGLCEKDSYHWWKHYSSYAPGNLMHDEQAPRHMQPYWYRAFLDLMATHNGEAMGSTKRSAWNAAVLEEASRDVHSSEDKKGLAWADDKPTWWPDSRFRPYFLASRMPDCDEVEKATTTEEDVYNTFLAQQERTRQANVFDSIANQEQVSASKVVSMIQNASRSQEQRDEAKQPSVVAMVTTSHTTTMPDGSSRTVRRYKKTFADGREESSEDIQDNHTQTQIPAAAPEAKKKGWFWS